MGFIDTAPGKELSVFYNVIHAVGANCPNARDDVKLIQYMLMAFYDRAVTSGLTRPSGDIAVTGYCGPATMNWILSFQRDYGKGHPGEIMVDNRVDRIRDKSSFMGSISKTYYTLAVLNASVKKQNPEAFVLLPGLIPLENPLNVPPPGWDTVGQPQIVPASGGM
ncbi:MAG TPA: hypothetical protein VK612_01730 [Pyrinomonadaceae bacterium]|nr:hypothetical protein [Pyrinomonadaceae bacterium]